MPPSPAQRFVGIAEYAVALLEVSPRLDWFLRKTCRASPVQQPGIGFDVSSRYPPYPFEQRLPSPGLEQRACVISHESRAVEPVGAFAIQRKGCSFHTLAGERLSIRGKYGGMNRREMLQVAPDHVIVTVLSESMGCFVDPPHDGTPLHLAAGPCRGVIEIKNARASGSGYCLRTNPSGGRWLLKWMVDPDASQGVHGTWEIAGVSGNAIGWKGGGVYAPSTETGEGRFVDYFSGWLQKD